MPLTDAAARESLVRLSLSVAEYATNSNGFAVLTYRDGDTVRCAAFVSKMAVSLLQPGVERMVEMENTHAPPPR
jgi:hypothetical protein